MTPVVGTPTLLFGKKTLILVTDPATAWRTLSACCGKLQFAVWP
jgi:hypothetical protein